MPARAEYFCRVRTKPDLKRLIADKRFREAPKLVLGGGSNILFVNDFPGLVIQPALLGKKILQRESGKVRLYVSAGESWDGFVRWSAENKFNGIENLVLIPGTVGGAVSQNIAAYGQNISDVVDRVLAIDLRTGKEFRFSRRECLFSYRQSRFKNIDRGRFCIYGAVFCLSEKEGKLETSYHERESRYGSLLKELASFAQEPYTAYDVMRAVVRQRQNKLPNLKQLGSCGSVFENPVVSVAQYQCLARRVPELQSYPLEKLSYEKKQWGRFAKSEKTVKIPAGRLLDELGWRGKWFDKVGVFDRHALCVVTKKGARGVEVKKIIEKMKASVAKAYGIDLHTEINIV